MHFPLSFCKNASPYFFHGAFVPSFIWSRHPWITTVISRTRRIQLLEGSDEAHKVDILHRYPCQLVWVITQVISRTCISIWWTTRKDIDCGICCSNCRQWCYQVPQGQRPSLANSTSCGGVIFSVKFFPPQSQAVAEAPASPDFCYP